MPRRRILDSSDDEDAYFNLSPKALAEAELEQALSSRYYSLPGRHAWFVHCVCVQALVKANTDTAHFVLQA